LDHFIYLSCYSEREKNNGVPGNSGTLFQASDRFNPFSEEFPSGILNPVLPFLSFNRRKKKDMYICFNQVL